MNARQLSFLPASFVSSSSVPPRPALNLAHADTYRYCDLIPMQVRDLVAPHQAAATTRNAFRRAGWIDEDGILTMAGMYVLRRAQAILAGDRPSPPVLDVPDDVRFHVRRIDWWQTAHLKCLLYLARYPGTGWRYLTGLFDGPVVEALRAANLVTGAPRRGAPQRITEDGLVVLRQALDRARVTYYIQTKTENQGE